MKTTETKFVSIAEAMKQGNSTTNQEIKQMFVQREVYANVNSMVEYILNKGFEDNNAPFTIDDISNYYSYPEFIGKYAKFDGGTEDERDEEIKRLNEILEELEMQLEDKDTDQDTKKINELKEQIADIKSEIEELENLDSEPQEVFEWWLVSSFLAEKLEAMGHPIIEGDNIWGRCTTGQAILLDYAITQICANMEILHGQRNAWK